VLHVLTTGYVIVAVWLSC